MVVENTCSIKLLKNAYIGAGVRMSKGTDTVPFENKPMKGLKIENYSKQGFRISHPDLPKIIWVDFDQLPLTRVTMKNGVIEDEITFVENIVLHKMQLIRTLDTEYMDLLYQEKKLAEKKDDIIPISEAVIGDWYKGAQCKEGLEMVYLGTWYPKYVAKKHHYSWGYSSKKDDSFHLSDKSPKRAFFAVQEGNKWDIISFPISNKKVKNLITLHKTEDQFEDRNQNREMILCAACSHDWSYYYEGKYDIPDHHQYFETSNSLIKEKFPFLVIKKYSRLDCSYISDTSPKEYLDEEAYNWANNNLCCTLETSLLDGSGYRSLAVGEIKFKEKPSI